MKHSLNGLSVLLMVVMVSHLTLQGEVDKGPRPEPRADSFVVKEKFQKALDLHQLGVTGDEKAVIEALGLLADLHKECPDDALILAFWGSASTLRARDAIFYRKMGHLRSGLEAIDQAVEMEPDNPHIRVIRAVNSYQLPGIFGRGSIAQEDFEFLVEWAEHEPDVFGNELLRFTYYHAGLYASRERHPEARNYLQQALEIPGESVSDQEIQRALIKSS